jgi:hypothetical protein
MGSFAASRTSGTADVVSSCHRAEWTSTHGLRRASSALLTARTIHCGLESVSVVFKACQWRRTLLLERLDDVFEFLSRGECVFTCRAAGPHLTSRTAASSSMRAWRSWKMAGLTPVMVRDVLRVLGESVDARGCLVEAMSMFVVWAKIQSLCTQVMTSVNTARRPYKTSPSWFEGTLVYRRCQLFA